MQTAKAMMMQRSDTDLDQDLSRPEMPRRAGRRKRRGHLKIFLGAAPSVGTTCEMIRAGITKHREGVDVVVGVVERHGRIEVEALLNEMEVVPSRGGGIDYGACEMDLDAILARQPTLVLVDELAHINPPGARNPRRYMDIRQLLRAGIDVYTTLNMQQVDSLSNIVTKIIRIGEGETVPDSVVNQADEIEVIDVPPGDIMQYLRRSKLPI